MSHKSGIQASISHMLAPVYHMPGGSKNNSPVRHENKAESLPGSPVHNGVGRSGSFSDKSRNALELFMSGERHALMEDYPAYKENSIWEGEKNQGFDVLYHNMKHGQISVKYLQDFIRESASSEDLYAKHLTKLAKQASNSSTLGSFAPMFEVFRVTAEKLSSCHMDVVHKLHDIIKELSKYLEEQKGKHKQVKDELGGTADALHQIQTTTATVHKSKEKYHQLCIEAERMRKSSALPKDLEKVEAKSKKAVEEYKHLVEKYENVRSNFEQKMTDTAKRFQEIEVAHLKHMKSVLDAYILSYENANVLIGQVHQEFRRQVGENTIDSLIKQYCESKGTGTERPGPIVFEECDVNSIAATAEPTANGGTADDVIMPPPNRNSRRPITLPFIRRRPRKSAKENIPAKNKDAEKEGESIESPDKDGSMKVDDEGYTIRPETPKGSKGSWGLESSDDSDSDDFTMRKIHVKINPKDEKVAESGGSDLVTLNAITKNLTLNSPTPLGGKRLTPTSNNSKKSRESPIIETKSKSVSDELFDIFGNNAPSTANNIDSFAGLFTSAASSTKNVPAEFSSSMTQSSSNVSLNNLLLMPSIDKEADKEVMKLTKTSAESPQEATTRPNDLSLTAAWPEPQKASSAPLAPSESWSSLSSFGGTPMDGFSSSRGPSPLTLMHGDPIPIAAAFTETVHAFFKGNNNDRCMVKVTGEVQISFPAGIIRAFTSNPNPATLSFKVKGASLIQDFTPNPKLLFTDSSQADSPERTFWFNMSSLISCVKKMTESNPNAPYYNVSVLSYQLNSQSGRDLVPLHLASRWKLEENLTEVNVDYSYNSKSFSTPLKNIQVIVPVDGGVTNADSTPAAIWNSSQNRLTWKMTNPISTASPSGTLCSRLTLAAGPSRSSTLAVQFVSEGSTLTGVEFELTGSGYRLSLVKKRFTSGKYLSEGNS
ncbi:F-BAR domain only protein 2-like isoform X1 [Clavelina lepadiformis]|uniref:F-BAR domain only protein 2-like isoform X1 n=1 Tax=Clavelina lepadiformis TaxID=159417 RepID=UPI004042E5F8